MENYLNILRVFDEKNNDVYFNAIHFNIHSS